VSGDGEFGDEGGMSFEKKTGKNHLQTVDVFRA
jgi:hypothetical protein